MICAMRSAWFSPTLEDEEVVLELKVDLLLLLLLLETLAAPDLTELNPLEDWLDEVEVDPDTLAGLALIFL